MNGISPLYFLRPSLHWGFVLGFLTGIPYLLFWWPYGPFGIIINMIIGLILGGINGILFSVLVERFISHRYYRIILLSNSLFITLIVSEIIYFIPFKAYSSSTIRGVAIAIFPSVINAIIAGYILQRAARLYKTGKIKK